MDQLLALTTSKLRWRSEHLILRHHVMNTDFLNDFMTICLLSYVLNVSLLRYPLKFTVERDNDIKLFPEEEELVNILNIKRGIISALAVPLLEEEMNKVMVS